MQDKNIFRKSDCQYPFWIRGRHKRDTKYHIKHKTDFGLFIIEHRKKYSVNAG